MMSKRRILEIYLNVIEWGDGVYGAEAAARKYFNTSAASLSPEQAAFLSAMIPNPRTVYSPAKHPRRVERRKNLILRLMRHVVIPRDLS
jgi:monofunctional biosynthetic peptidoglycan transglycosylase